MDKYHQTNPPTELKSAVMGRENSRKGSPASACSAESDVQRDRRFIDETYGPMTSDRVEQDKYMNKLGVITAYRLWITEQNA